MYAQDQFDRIWAYMNRQDTQTDGHPHQMIKYKNGAYKRKMFAIYNAQQIGDIARRWFIDVSFVRGNDTYYLTSQVGYKDLDREVFNSIFEPYGIYSKRDFEGYIVLENINPGAENPEQLVEANDDPAEPVADNENIRVGMQKIFFGAPGTGKSYKIENNLFKDGQRAYGLSSISEKQKFRTTFHPDYDYAQFVGSYKPQSDDNGKIAYSFVPQVFTRAYVVAWTKFIEPLIQQPTENEPLIPEEDDDELNNDNNVYLVIEEINRGNCAQIFGDIFQLLDRNEEGYSQYSINADYDFAEYIKKELSEKEGFWEKYLEYVEEGKLLLPPNFHIVATMNTSDQSLFPMDSAFKRRFDWEYVPIKYEKDSGCGENWDADKFKIVVGNSKYMWLTFLKKVNENVYLVTKSEDKQMGEFFIKPKNGKTISFEEFRSKVLFYLWDSVYKDEEGNPYAKQVFHFELPGNTEKTLSFQDLYKEPEIRVKLIMSKLGVDPIRLHQVNPQGDVNVNAEQLNANVNIEEPIAEGNDVDANGQE